MFRLWPRPPRWPRSPEFVDELEQRRRLLAQLEKLVVRLPNGLLYRLVEDARFFNDWNLRKRSARSSSRIAQSRNQQAKAEEKRWKSTMREKGLDV